MTWIPWAVFFISAGAIILAGTRLSREGDAIAEITGLGGVWIGAILVAIATSLPELTTDIFAVRMGEGDMALGDLFGSSMANMLILAVLDTVTRQQRLLHTVAIRQALLCLTAILVTTLAAFGMVWQNSSTVAGIGGGALLIAITYLAGMRMLYRHPHAAEYQQKALQRGVQQVEHRSLLKASLWFAASALVILIAAGFLARSARDIAQQLGIGTGFVGLLLVGLTTSMPEAVVSLASLRTGSFDLAVGNLFGSNAINMAMIPILDAVDGPGSLLATASPALLAGPLIAVIMMSLALLEVLYRSETRIWRLEPDATLQILVYLAGMLFLFYQSRL